MKDLNEKINKYFVLKKLFDKNADDFKKGELTYEELHTMQYVLIHNMENIRKEIIDICDNFIDTFQSIKEKFKNYKN